MSGIEALFVLVGETTSPDFLLHICQVIRVTRFPTRAAVVEMQKALSEAFERVQGTWKARFLKSKISDAAPGKYEQSPQCSYAQARFMVQVLTSSRSAGAVEAVVEAGEEMPIWPVNEKPVQASLADAQVDVLTRLAMSVNETIALLGQQYDRMPAGGGSHPRADGSDNR